jgi:hypothetical protein
MREHYLNSTQVLAEAWSVADNALKIIPAANTQFAVSLDAADGAVSCVGMKTVCLYGVGAITVSPSDEGEDFFALSATELVPLAICARRIKITGAGKAVVQAV